MCVCEGVCVSQTQLKRNVSSSNTSILATASSLHQKNAQNSSNILINKQGCCNSSFHQRITSPVNTQCKLVGDSSQSALISILPNDQTLNMAVGREREKLTSL